MWCTSLERCLYSDSDGFCYNKIHTEMMNLAKVQNDVFIFNSAYSKRCIYDFLPNFKSY